MAGFSIVMLVLLFAWPIALVIGVCYLTFEAAALVVTSPAFPFLIMAMIAATAGTVNAALVMWRHYKATEASGDSEPFEAKDLKLRTFKWTYILYAISFAACCAAVYYSGVSVFGLFSRA